MKAVRDIMSGARVLSTTHNKTAAAATTTALLYTAEKAHIFQKYSSCSTPRQQLRNSYFG